MWEYKSFKTYEQATEFINKNKSRYQMQLLFVANGYCVEYRKLRKVY